MFKVKVALCAAGLISASVFATPLSLNRQNPHYFEYESRAAVLVTSGEHYGAVINQDFDYTRYLDELAKDHLNLTRVWSGTYRELPGDFRIGNNTLAPRPSRFISPWLQSGGEQRVDLHRWNPDYFRRLHDFLKQASRRKIVVELNLFCSFYNDSMWKASPLNAANNVNGIGNVPRAEVLSTAHRDLLEVEDAYVRKIVTEVNRFDNVYFEICNEPYATKVQPDWQRHISSVIADTEKQLPKRHLISQNVANGSQKVDAPDPNVSIFNFHYSRPPLSVAQNYDLNRPIGFNETGFDGQADSTYRIQAWAFLAAGGALYNNLDYSFTVGHESGDYRFDKQTPGGGGPALRKQLGILLQFFRSLDLEEFRPAQGLVKVSPGDSTAFYALAAPGKTYVVYLDRASIQPDLKPRFKVDATARASTVSIDLPLGSYRGVWIQPKTGAVLSRFEFKQQNSTRTIATPAFSEDIVLKIQQR